MALNTITLTLIVFIDIIAHPSVFHSPPVFSGVRVGRCLVFCLVFCRLLLVPIIFAIVLSVL